MENKILPTVTEIKQALIDRLIVASKALDVHDRMQVAINLKIALTTVDRYTSGDAEEVRNLELAEKIANAADALIANKKIIA